MSRLHLGSLEQRDIGLVHGESPVGRGLVLPERRGRQVELVRRQARHANLGRQEKEGVVRVNPIPVEQPKEYE